MRAISLFSGVEGFGIGFARAGIETVLQAEQDPWCLEVLARHYPETERVTDVRLVGRHIERGGESDHGVRGGRGADLVYGGFPCQDVSVAGKRAGLDGARSGLWFEFHRVLRELRPRWAVIENVPGLLSSNQGRDFAVILDGLDELGFDVAWAVLDAQHFGVPQRRRRVFIVAGPRGRGPEQVLSLCEGCGGNPAAGEAAGEGVAGTLGGGSADSSRGYRNDLDGNGAFISTIPIQDAREVDKQQNGIGIGSDGDPMFTLDGASRHAVAVSLRGREGGGTAEVGGEQSNALRASQGGGDKQHVLIASAISASAGHHGHSSPRGYGSDNLVASSVTSKWSKGSGGPAGDEVQNLTLATAGVRRLTPLECERLMGWPDDYTRWTASGKEISDSHRYRMAGNGVVATVAEWLGHRLIAVDREIAG